MLPEISTESRNHKSHPHMLQRIMKDIVSACLVYACGNETDLMLAIR